MLAEEYFYASIWYEAIMNKMESLEKVLSNKKTRLKDFFETSNILPAVPLKLCS